jgi:hypothetical protein
VEEKAVRIRRLARMGWLRRLARRLWMSNSRLRRRTDRIEAWITAGLIAVFLVGAPLSIIGAGRWAEQGVMREQHAQQSWHQVAATLLEAAPAQPQFEFGLPWNPVVLVLAHWMGPDGRDQIGQIPVKAGTWAGRTVELWVDRLGRPTGPPLPGSVLAERVTSAKALAPAALAALLLVLAWLVRRLMDRRRLAAWEADWALTGPRWTRRRH